MKIIPLTASTFQSDGGAMYGFIPRAIWEKKTPPDETNRIPQHANVLLIETDDGELGLVDSGCGPASTYTEKMLVHNGLGPGWPLAEAFHARGIDREQIDFVILTHLHWDHVKGCLDAEGRAAFPNAVHHVDLDEIQDALTRNSLLHKSYPTRFIEQLLEQVSVRRHLHDPKKQLASNIRPGITLVRTGGHTRGHCMVLIEAGEARLIFAADVCPTQHHLPLVFQTSFDTFPLDTRLWKQKWLPICARPDTWLMFCHDPLCYGAKVETDKETGAFRIGATWDKEIRDT